MSENRPGSPRFDPEQSGRPARSAHDGPPLPPGPLWHAPGDTPPYGVRPGHTGDTGGYGAPAYGSYGAGPGGSNASGTGEPHAPGPGKPDKRRRRRPSSLTMVVAALAVLLLVGGGIGAFLLAPAGEQTDRVTKNAAGQQRWPAGDPPVKQADASAPDWVATAAAVAPSVVSITIASNGSQGSGQGSGVILDREGHIVTNHHVVASGIGGGATILVTLNDKRAYQADIVGTDASTDLAVLQLKDGPGDLTPITMGNDTQLKVGSPVMAVGNPLGLAGTVTTGIVSALNRPVTTQQASGNSAFGGGGELVVTNAIQTSAAINPGNSGGALVNASGQLVGINSSIAQTSQDGGNIGIGFAIPVNEARSVSDQILRNGVVRHPYLGVTGQGGYVREGNAQRAAAVIERITPNSPAAGGGLRSGDAVVALDDEPVDSWEALMAQVREREVGNQVKVTVIRDGSRQDVTVTLAQRPDNP